MEAGRRQGVANDSQTITEEGTPVKEYRVMSGRAVIDRHEADNLMFCIGSADPRWDWKVIFASASMPKDVQADPALFEIADGTMVEVIVREICP